jgi:hypothetical protein
VSVAGQRPSRHHLKRVRFRSSRPALHRTRQHPPSLTHLRSKSGRGCRPPVMAGFARDVQAAGIRGVGPLYTYPELRFGAEVGCDSATKPRFWELAGRLEPPTCCLQDRSGSSTACWRVLSLQLRSGGSSSQCAPDRPSSGRWNDKQNDMPTAPPWRPIDAIGGARPGQHFRQRRLETSAGLLQAGPTAAPAMSSTSSGR